MEHFINRFRQHKKNLLIKKNSDPNICINVRLCYDTEKKIYVNCIFFSDKFISQYKKLIIIQ
jgi:hypothetical protein